MNRISIATDNFHSDALKSGIAKAVYFSLLQRVPDSPEISFSARELAREVGVDEKTVRNHLNAFYKSGLISAPKSAESPHKIRTITLCGIGVLNEVPKKRKSAPKSAESPQLALESLPLFHYVADDMKSAWEDWLAYRKSIKKPFASERQEQIAYGKLMRETNNDYQTAKAMIEQSIAYGWQGLFPLKNGERFYHQIQQPASGSRSRLASLREATAAILQQPGNLDSYFNDKG